MLGCPEECAIEENLQNRGSSNSRSFTGGFHRISFQRPARLLQLGRTDEYIPCLGASDLEGRTRPFSVLERFFAPGQETLPKTTNNRKVEAVRVG